MKCIRTKMLARVVKVLVDLCLTAVVVGQVYPPCGTPTVTPIAKRIVGGHAAAQGSWPWLAMLVDDNHYISGTGIILNKHVLLTSAQIFEGPGYSVNDVDLRQWKVFTGAYDMDKTGSYEREYRIRSVALHPAYDGDTIDNDIALIYISGAYGIQYNSYTRPACLPDSTHTYAVGNICYVPGWGETHNTANDKVLNQIAMPILDDSVCQRHYPTVLNESEICVGMERGGKDWCDEDLGSPLTCRGQNGVWYIQGIASSGANCTAADEPSLFKDILYYNHWIKKTMRDAGYPYTY